MKAIKREKGSKNTYLLKTSKPGYNKRMNKSKAMPTYKRQRFLLEFIRQIKNGVTSTDLQKLVFLHIMKEKLDFYDFIPYKFGSYSFQLAEDVDIMRKNGFLSTDNSKIKAIGDDSSENVFWIADERGNELIRKVYQEYPYYAINSEITGRLFSKDEAERFRTEKQNYYQTEQVLYTIGYEGRSIEAFINTLIQNDIRLLCDVRKNPFSRKFGFSKKMLEHVTETIEIKYINLSDLGIDSDKRGSLETKEDYKNLFKSYKNNLPSLKIYLDQLYSLFCSNVRIALMCYEKEAEMCHRHIIRDYLINNYMIKSEDL